MTVKNEVKQKTKQETKQERNQETKQETNNTEDVFTKEQIASSACYRDKRDAVNVVLENGKSYSFAEADKLLNEFMKGKVN